MGEFDLIRRFFQRPVRRAALGVGDDCALLAPAPGMQLAVSSDMLVEGRHFFAEVDPRLLGHKSLAVNLSDLAACGARPLAFTLALSLPRADAAWTEAVAAGRLALDELCRIYRPAVLAFLRRRGMSRDAAEESTQSFFLHLLERELASRADPARGVSVPTGWFPCFGSSNIYRFNNEAAIVSPIAPPTRTCLLSI